MNSNEILTRVGNKIRTVLLKYEILLLVLIILSGILKVMAVPQSGMIATIIFASAGIIYFFYAFADNFKTELSGFDRFFFKLLSLGSSVSCIGMLFKLQKWPYSINMIAIGDITLLLCLIYIIYQRNKLQETQVFDNNLIYRAIVLIGLSAAVYFVVPQQ